MKIKRLKITDIEVAMYNPRRDLQPGDAEYERLRKSIEEFDLVEPLVVNERSDGFRLIGGHQRYKILKARGDKEVEVSVVRLDDVKEKALNLALNKIGGDWDFPLLADVLAELEGTLEDIEISGFSADELESIVAEFGAGAGEGQTDPDDVPDVPETPVTKPGDLYALGKHRLLCGDSTKAEDVERLMAGEKADMVFTDPPYGVGWKYANYKDNENNLLELIDKVIKRLIKNVPNVLVFCGYKNMFLYPKPEWIFGVVLPAGTGFNKFGFSCFHPILIWAKNFKKGPDIIVLPNAKRDESDHPCGKPLVFLDWILERFSKAGHFILDPFGGSGSTLIACEQTGRQCRMIEIDAHYCDVIVARYKQYTGRDDVKLLENVHAKEKALTPAARPRGRRRKKKQG